MAILYRIALFFYAFGIRLASFFNPKAKAWITGRQQWQKKLVNLNLPSSPVWFHCASYGEYLQALPVINGLFEKYKCPIIVSFFSPSGYQNFKETAAVKSIFYLPIDSPSSAKKCVEILQPKLFVGVKYDVWPYLQAELKRNKIPQILIAAQFRNDQIYFKSWGSFYKTALQSFHPIFCQYPSSSALLQSEKIPNTVVGDPRFDQAIENTKVEYTNSSIEAFAEGEKVIVFGSAWESEMGTLAELLIQFPNEKFIVAPHEIHTSHIKKIFKSISENYSLLSQNECNNRILVIDKIGELRYIYKHAKLAVIGGGFTGKVHNIIEALAYGTPIFIGDNHSRFPEVQYASSIGALKNAESPKKLAETIAQALKQPVALEKMSIAAHQCVSENKGATTSVLNHPIFDKVLL